MSRQQLVSLGAICDFKNGRAFKKNEWKTDSGLPIIRIKNLNNSDAPYNYFDGEYDESIHITSGDLMFSWSGTIGSSFGPHLWDREDGVLNQHIFKVSLREDIDKNYAFYALLWITGEIEKQVNGAVGLVHITKTKLKKFEVPLPALPEQKQIVSLLDQAFLAIDKAIANTEKNLANARELFESYLNQAYSGIEERRKFGDVCGFVRGPFGGSLKKSCFVDEGVAVYEQQHAIHKDFENIRYFIDEDKFSEMSRFEVFSGDLLMSCSGTIGKVAIVPQGSMKGIINQALLKLSPNEELDGRYLKYWMESENFLSEISRHSQGAAMKNIASVKVLKQIDVPTPQLEVQNQVIARLDELSEAIAQIVESNRKKVAALNELKQSILQKAFRGKLTGEVAEGFSAA